MNEIYGHITHTISTTLSSHLTNRAAALVLMSIYYLLTSVRLAIARPVSGVEWGGEATYIATSRVLRVRENPRLMDITDSSNTFFFVALFPEWRMRFCRR